VPPAPPHASAKAAGNLLSFWGGKGQQAKPAPPPAAAAAAAGGGGFHAVSVAPITVVPLSCTLGALAALAASLAPYGLAADFDPAAGASALVNDPAAFRAGARPPALRGLYACGAPADVSEGLRGAWAGVSLLLELMPAWEPAFPGCAATALSAGGVAAALARARGKPPPPPQAPPRPFRFVAVAPGAALPAPPSSEEQARPRASSEEQTRPRASASVVESLQSAAARRPPSLRAPPPALLGRVVLVPVQPHTTVEDVAAYARVRLGVPPGFPLLAARSSEGLWGLGATAVEKILGELWSTAAATAPPPPPPSSPPPEEEQEHDIVILESSPEDEDAAVRGAGGPTAGRGGRLPPPPCSADAPSAAALGGVCAPAEGTHGVLQLILGLAPRAGKVEGSHAAVALPLLVAPCPPHVVAAAGRVAVGGAAGMDEEEEGGDGGGGGGGGGGEGGGAPPWCPLQSLTGGAQLVQLPAGSWPAPPAAKAAGRAAGLVPTAAAVPVLLQSIRALHAAAARAAKKEEEEEESEEEGQQGVVTVKSGGSSSANKERGVKL